MSGMSQESLYYLHKRIRWYVVIVCLFLLGVAGRLYYLQIYQGQHYDQKAAEVFVREEEIVARRGAITDRNGKIIADTRPYYEISITRQYVSDLDSVVKSLKKVLPEIDEEDVHAKIKAAYFEPKFRPVAVVEDVPYDWVAILQEYLSPGYQNESELDFSGVTVRFIPIRKYLYPHLFAHVMGYLTEIDKIRLEKAKKDFPGVFSLGDLRGAAGVEQAYDIELKGKDGILGRVVDARGREVNATSDLKRLQQQVSRLPVPGYTLRTTLDFKAQLAAQEAFGDRKGAVVAINPNNGEVYTLYSSPGYDANRITKIVDRKYWAKINLDEDKYLFNRAIQAMYPPASTYKVVGVTAGVHSGLIDPKKTKFVCRGGIRFGNRFFKCWKSGGHGSVDALKALAQSCDVFFYRVGLLLGVDRLAEYAEMFGLNHKTGIEIPYEKSGLIPTQAWKKKARKQEWMESETLSVSIGQSYDLTTTLQNAVMASMVANGGYRVVPHVGLEILDPYGKVIKKISKEPIKTPLSDDPSLNWAKQGMVDVVHGAGTAKKLRSSPYKIAGKTGTAQVVGHGSRVRGKKAENHALFISFAPYYDPQIAVAVMVEHGRGGSAAAAPVAQKVIDAYMSKFNGPF